MSGASRTGPRRGFTLMELLTVMVIMGILMTAGVASYIGARRGAEMRAAVGTLRATLAMARQHAVTKRRTTCVVFRNEGGTNCYYVFEKNGMATASHPTDLIMDPPPNWPADGSTVCNMDGRTQGWIGRLNAHTPAIFDRRKTTWKDGGGNWSIGDSFGFQVGDKSYIPPGVDIDVDRSGASIFFYSNGKADGVDTRTIQLTDRMGTGVKTVTVYPLVGLIESK